ncbi:hypothetical protein [Dactylosporangium sp. NPDC000521]|uniref:hypothetical protein n=1 Tax=Dactylosporangium sp. NPDC000521 TaxID=3363975 RepID=UPI0036977E65
MPSSYTPSRLPSSSSSRLPASYRTVREVEASRRAESRPVRLTTRTPAQRTTPVDTRPAVTAPPPPPPSNKAAPSPPPPPVRGPAAGAGAAKPANAADDLSYQEQIRSKRDRAKNTDPRQVMRQRLGEIDVLLRWHEGLLVPVADAQEILALEGIVTRAKEALKAPDQALPGDLVAEVAGGLASANAIGLRQLREMDGAKLEAKVVEANRKRAAAAKLDQQAPAAPDPAAAATPSLKAQVQAIVSTIPKGKHVRDNAEWAKRLIAAGQYNAAAYVIEHTWLIGKRRDVAAKAAEEDKKKRREALRKPDLIKSIIEGLSNGQLDEARTLLDELINNTVLPAAEGGTLLKQLIDEAFRTGAAQALATTAPDIVASLIVGAIKLSELKDEKRVVDVTRDHVAALRGQLSGEGARAVATSALTKHWRSGAAAEPDTFSWLLANIDPADWNDVEKGLAARAYNMLWHAGQYDDMLRLIDMDVSTHLPASDGSDTGRNREGVWSGWVQPLEHLLGNYVRLADPEIMKGVTDPAELRKVLGARQLLERIAPRADTTILTTWKEVVASQLIQGFEDAPGTIWGFEDVRLPYVQAAHDTTKGKQPLRMIEIWDAAEQALNAVGYPGLLADPEKVIADCVTAGLAKLETNLKEKPREYYGRESAAFKQQFEEQAGAYLRFLAKQTPKAKIATAELSGKKPDKWMGALGCKAGLWWAAEKGEPVYYVLDGLNEKDAINYKTWKTKKINARMENPLKVQAFGEVITLSEIREILNHWDDEDQKLRKVIKMVEKGRILEGDDLKKVDDWAKEMKANDSATKSATSRISPTKEALKPKLEGLEINPNLMALDAPVLKQIALQVDLVRMAADAHYELLSGALADCKVLYDNNLLPKNFAEYYAEMLKLPLGDQREELASKLITGYLTEDQVASALLQPLRTAVEKWAITPNR